MFGESDKILRFFTLRSGKLSGIAKGAKIIIADSLSHEHDGEGGVLDQIEDYKSYVVEHKDDIEHCYTEVAKNVCAFKEIGWERPVSPLFKDIANGDKTLTLGSEPKVGLVVFGFDLAQRVHEGWEKNLKRLEAGTTVIARGDAKAIRL